eukprot:364584-Chlamydomonas_euryale.AAC.17
MVTYRPAVTGAIDARGAAGAGDSCERRWSSCSSACCSGSSSRTPAATACTGSAPPLPEPAPAPRPAFAPAPEPPEPPTASFARLPPPNQLRRSGSHVNHACGAVDAFAAREPIAAAPACAERSAATCTPLPPPRPPPAPAPGSSKRRVSAPRRRVLLPHSGTVLASARSSRPASAPVSLDASSLHLGILGTCDTACVQGWGGRRRASQHG